VAQDTPAPLRESRSALCRLTGRIARRLLAGAGLILAFWAFTALSQAHADVLPPQAPTAVRPLLHPKLLPPTTSTVRAASTAKAAKAAKAIRPDGHILRRTLGGLTHRAGSVRPALRVPDAVRKTGLGATVRKPAALLPATAPATDTRLGGLSGALDLPHAVQLPGVAVQLPEVAVPLPEVAVRLPEVAIRLPDVAVQLPGVSLRLPGAPVAGLIGAARQGATKVVHRPASSGRYEDPGCRSDEPRPPCSAVSTAAPHLAWWTASAGPRAGKSPPRSGEARDGPLTSPLRTKPTGAVVIGFRQQAGWPDLTTPMPVPVSGGSDSGGKTPTGAGYLPRLSLPAPGIGGLVAEPETTAIRTIADKPSFSPD
jgi:hypothetical protein